MFKSLRASYPIWVAAFFLAAVFLMGGGARGDIQSLVLLRPLAAICIGIALWSLTRDEFASAKLPLVFMSLIPLIIILQLIPLPPAIWTNLPGRELHERAALLAGIEQPWRPISLMPYRTWNSLFAWLVPIAMVLLVLKLDRERRYLLLPILIALGLASGVFGIIQIMGPSYGPLYFYEITNSGMAVGLFANRNHQATLLACLFPMLAVYASIETKSLSRMRLKTLLCGATALFIVPLLLVTGSRAGLVLGVIGLLSAAVIYSRPNLVRSRSRSRHRIRFGLRWQYAVGAAMFLILAGTTAILSRAEAIDRLLVKDETEGLRILLLEPIWEMIQTYFPVGIGFGAFPDVYKIHEPFDLLSSAYVNHAHNDLLEFVLEGGLPAVVALFVGLIAWVIGVSRLRTPTREGGRAILFGRLGAVIILILGIASIVDYPLRVPSISAVFAIATMWMAFGAGSSMRRESDASAPDDEPARL